MVAKTRETPKFRHSARRLQAPVPLAQRANRGRRKRRPTTRKRKRPARVLPDGPR